MPEGKTADYLAQEYFFLQKAIEDFDARSLTIKAWSVTFSATGLGLAYQQHNRVLLLVAAGSALAFWIVEAVWKFNQRAFYPRIQYIEAWFAEQSGEQNIAPFQITSQWGRDYFTGWTKPAARRAWAARGHAFVVPFFAGVMMPHVVVFFAGLLLYRYAPPVLAVTK